MNQHSTSHFPDIRAAAERQFEFVQQNHDMLDLTQDDATEQVRLQRLLLDAILALPAGELLDFKAALPGIADDDRTKRLIIRGIPFLMGSLRLLDLEFYHPEIGVLPYDVVRGLINNQEEVPHQGIVLTAKNVTVQYRRLPIS